MDAVKEVHAIRCAEARDASSVTAYDAAVLDLGLPDGDGRTLLAELQSSRYKVARLVRAARYASALIAVAPVTRTTRRVPRQPGCKPLALYTAAALGPARKSISAFAAIGCSDKCGVPAT